MKGLFLKDFYLVNKYCRSYLIIIVVYSVICAFSAGNAFLIFYPVLFSSILPTTLLSYDEKSKWDKQADCMPVSRRQQVSVKYCIAVSVLLLYVFLSGTGQTVQMFSSHSFSAAKLFQTEATLFGTGLLSAGLILPPIFKLGVEKGRIAYYILLVVFCALFMWVSISDNNAILLAAFSFHGTTGAALLLAGALLLFALSWYLSAHFYQRREL